MPWRKDNVRWRRATPEISLARIATPQDAANPVLRTDLTTSNPFGSWPNRDYS